MARKHKHFPPQAVQAKRSPSNIPQRKPRLLWACPWCMLDTSSGASMAVREMLLQLVKQGYEVMVLGATIFDAEKGTYRLREHWETLRASLGKLVNVNDGPLTHRLFITNSIVRNQMTTEEEGTWYASYIHVLDTFRPDLVYFYGGQTLDLLISDEAHARGIPCAAYLANGNYQATRWCRDVDVIITDSQATADMYAEKQGFKAVPVGAFIDPGPVLATGLTRKHVLLVNPSLAKGAGVVIQLAMALETRRPDIVFEVVESRGNWHGLVQQVSAAMGQPRESLNNVIVTPNTDDMRPIYGRARLLLAPSLWWESFGRVAAEAMMNGIPALVTNRGGLPEVIGDGGIVINFPEKCYEAPYTHLPESSLLAPLLQAIERMYDDTAYYEHYAQRALQVGERHRIEVSTGRLMQAFAPFVRRFAGEGAANPYAERANKQLALEVAPVVAALPKTTPTPLPEPKTVHEQFLSAIAKEIDFKDWTGAEQKLYRNLRLSVAWRLNQLKEIYLKNHGSIVRAGPLAGLDFVLEQTDGCIIPKLMGCYEQKILPFIAEAIENNYKTIVDIGCAEGYYAVGMAVKMPSTQVHAYDISEKAQAACKALAKKNGVDERVFVKGEFQGKDFSTLDPISTLIICDIEGAEKELLDPEIYPALKELDMIIESHDCYTKGMTSLLVRRFENSHDVVVVEDVNSRNLEWMPEWYGQLSNLDQLLMVWEMREGPTPWVILKSKFK